MEFRKLIYFILPLLGYPQIPSVSCPFKLSQWHHSFSVILVQFSSVAQSCPTLCDPMNHSTLGLPVHHQLLEFTQTHVHRVSDAIQPSHPLASPSPPAPNPSQHQSLFQWVSSSQRWPKYWSFSYLLIFNYSSCVAFLLLHLGTGHRIIGDPRDNDFSRVVSGSGDSLG